MQNKPQMTDFGFAQVPQADKQGLVRDVFDRAASRYDIMNDVMSGGLHRLWKRRMIDALYLSAQTRPLVMLDVAGGTGDIALYALRRAAQLSLDLQVKVLDINHEMLKAGQARMEKAPPKKRDLIEFINANAETLPLENSSADIYTIAFGMRNITHRAKALAEAWRVLKPGGRFVCLEFSHFPTPLTQALYDAYSFRVIPRLGKLIAGDGEPYRYLVESIRQFPRPAAFVDEIEAAGFARVGTCRLSGGVAALHYGWRL